MGWVYQFDERALKDMRKLGKVAQREILRYLDERIVSDEDPRRFGKALKAELSGLWRYRVGDYRVICQIRDGELVVMVVVVGHRRDVYL